MKQVTFIFGFLLLFLAYYFYQLSKLPGEPSSYNDVGYLILVSICLPLGIFLVVKSILPKSLTSTGIFSKKIHPIFVIGIGLMCILIGYLSSSINGVFIIIPGFIFLIIGIGAGISHLAKENIK
jgi:hypothetical protein